jgi:hypothetical protein
MWVWLCVCVCMCACCHLWCTRLTVSTATVTVCSGTIGCIVYMWVWSCVCVCVCVCEHRLGSTYLHVCERTYTCSMQVCVCVCTYVNTHLCARFDKLLKASYRLFPWGTDLSRLGSTYLYMRMNVRTRVVCKCVCVCVCVSTDLCARFDKLLKASYRLLPWCGDLPPSPHSKLTDHYCLPDICMNVCMYVCMYVCVYVYVYVVWLNW